MISKFKINQATRFPSNRYLSFKVSFFSKIISFWQSENINYLNFRFPNEMEWCFTKNLGKEKKKHWEPNKNPRDVFNL